MKYFYQIGICIVLCCGCQNTTETNWCLIRGGTVTFGNDEGMENEKPAIKVSIDDFYLSSTEVSNKEFEEFVRATRYETEAEKSGESMVFVGTKWQLVKGADWRHPEGSESSIIDRMDYPVVHISYNDAMAYCAWKNVRLPSEIELEYVLQKTPRPLSELNITSSQKGGRIETVKSRKKDDLGCYHVAGNVWEWCRDTYNYEIHDKWAGASQNNPVHLNNYFDPLKDSHDTLRVIKGGSFLCQEGYCAGYRSYARQSCEQSGSYFYIGFRIAKNAQ